MKKQGITTGLLHSDRSGKPEHGSLLKPVHHSVAYGYEKSEDLAAVFQGRAPGYAYGRQSNPTVTALEAKVTRLEEGRGSVAFSTGMGAIAATILSLLEHGDHLIASSFLFGNTSSLLATLQRVGIEVDFVDATELSAVKAACRPKTRMVFVETIANPVTQIADLEQIATLCQKKDLLFVVDNTMTSPVLFRPGKIGASLSVQSLTKYIGGHGNALGGVVTDLGNFDWAKFPGIQEIYRHVPAAMQGLVQIRKKGLRDMGAALSPTDAQLISSGSETLALRMEKNGDNAMALAQLLQNHEAVQKVHYPGLPDHPQHERAAKLFLSFGALLSFELVDGRSCMEVLDRLQIVICSSNLGDNRTLGIPVAQTIFWEIGAQKRSEMGIRDSLVRLSVGIEDQEDLLDDFRQALA